MAELRPPSPPPSATGTRSRAKVGIIAGVAVVAATGLGALLYLNVILPALQGNQERVRIGFAENRQGIEKSDIQFSILPGGGSPGNVINTASDPNVETNVFTTNVQKKLLDELPVSICDANANPQIHLSDGALNFAVEAQDERDVVFDGDVADNLGLYADRYADRVVSVKVLDGAVERRARPGLIRAESSASQIFLSYVNDLTGQVVVIPVAPGTGLLRVSACGASASIPVTVDFKNEDTGESTFLTHNPSGRLDTRYISMAWISPRMNERNDAIRSARLSGTFIQDMFHAEGVPDAVLRGIATIYLSNDGGQTWTAPDDANRLVIGDERAEQQLAIDDITYTFRSTGHDFRYAAYLVQDDNTNRSIAGNERGFLPVATAHAAPGINSNVTSLSAGTVLQTSLINDPVLQGFTYKAFSPSTTTQESSLLDSFSNRLTATTLPSDVLVFAPGASIQPILDATPYSDLTLSSSSNVLSSGQLVSGTPLSSGALSSGVIATDLESTSIQTVDGSITASDFLVPAQTITDSKTTSVLLLDDAILRNSLRQSFSPALSDAFFNADPKLSLDQLATTLDTSVDALTSVIKTAATATNATTSNSQIDPEKTGALVSTTNSFVYFNFEAVTATAQLAEGEKMISAESLVRDLVLRWPNLIYDTRLDTDNDPISIPRDAVLSTLVDVGTTDDNAFRFIYGNLSNDIPAAIPVAATSSLTPFWSWSVARSENFPELLLRVKPATVSFQQLSQAGLFDRGAQEEHPFLGGLHYANNILRAGPKTALDNVKDASAAMYWLAIAYQDRPTSEADPVVPTTSQMRLVANPPKRVGLKDLTITLDYTVAQTVPLEDEPTQPTTPPTTDTPKTCEELVEEARAKGEVPPVCDQPSQPEDLEVEGAKISAQLIHRNDSRVIVKFKFDDAAEHVKYKDKPIELTALCKEKGQAAKLTPKTYYDSKDEAGYNYYFVLTGLKGGRFESDNADNLDAGHGQYGCDVAGASFTFETLNRPELVCYVQNRITGEIPNPRDCATVAKIREASFLKTRAGQLLRDPEGLVFWVDPNLVTPQADGKRIEPVSRSGLPIAMILDKARKEFPQRVAATQIANARHQVLQGGNVPAEVRALANANAKDEPAKPLEPVCDDYAVRRAYQVFHDRLYEADLYKMYDDAGVKFWKAQCSEIPEKDRLDVNEAFIGIATSEEQIDLFKSEYVQTAGADAAAATCGYQVNFSFFQALKRPSEESANTFFCQKHDNLKAPTARKALVRELALSDEQKNRLSAIEKADADAFLPGCTQGEFQAAKEVYNTCFNRPADIEGAKYWCQQPNLAPFDLNARFCEAGEVGS